MLGKLRYVSSEAKAISYLHPMRKSNGGVNSALSFDPIPVKTI